jgi:hypothetical protein
MCNIRVIRVNRARRRSIGPGSIGRQAVSSVYQCHQVNMRQQGHRVTRGHENMVIRSSGSTVTTGSSKQNRPNRSSGHQVIRATTGQQVIVIRSTGQQVIGRQVNRVIRSGLVRSFRVNRVNSNNRAQQVNRSSGHQGHRKYQVNSHQGQYQ